MFFKKFVFLCLGMVYGQNVYTQVGTNLPSFSNQPPIVLPGANDQPGFGELENCIDIIRKLNHNYTASEEKLNRLNQETDPAKRDSLWKVLKEEVVQVNNEQINLFSEMDQVLPEEFESLKNAAAYNGKILQIHGKEIPEWQDIGRMEYYLDNGKENLKNFTDFHLAESGKDYFGDQNGRNLSGMLLSEDYGEFLNLNEKTLPGGERQEAARLNDLKTGSSQAVDKKKFKVIEKNKFKGIPLKNRLTAGIAINSLESLTEGFNLNFHGGFHITHQFTLFSGPTLKKDWNNTSILLRPEKEGIGIQTGGRFTYSKWLGQAAWERNKVNISYPSGAPRESYHGITNSLLIGLGRKIPLKEKWNAVITGVYDLGFQHDRRLHNSPFLLRMGVEFN